jgi:hypothetical protein
MTPSFTEKQKAMLKRICFYIWLFFIPIGLLATVNPSFLSIMMDQPSNFTACITCLAVVYLYCGNFAIKDKLTFVFMLASGLIAVHSQFYIFFLLVCALIMYFHHADVLKSNLKTGLALTVVVGVIGYFSRYEIINYIIPAGVTGGGFASLATYATSEFIAQLNNYSFNPVNSFINNDWLSGPASYYPILAQLGIVGILLYLSFWGYVIATAMIQFKQNGNIQPFIIILILAVFIFLENVSDSFFTSNKGYFMMMFIGLVLAKPEETNHATLFTDKNTLKKKKFAARQALWIFRRKSTGFLDNKNSIQEIPYIVPSVPITKNEPLLETQLEIQPINDAYALFNMEDHEEDESPDDDFDAFEDEDEDGFEIEDMIDVEDVTDEVTVEVVEEVVEEVIDEAIEKVVEETHTEEILEEIEEEIEEEDYDDPCEQEIENNMNHDIESEIEPENTGLELIKEDIVEADRVNENMMFFHAIPYNFVPSDSSLHQKNIFITEDNRGDDFSEDSFNYMI